MLRREFIRVFYQMGYNKLIQAKEEEHYED
jgi:hypothetical protein